MKYLFALTLFIIGCYTPKKAEKQLNKAKDKYPDLVAQKTSEWYPCKDIKTIVDSSEYKKWLATVDSLLNIKKDTAIVIDTLEITNPNSDCSKYKSQLVAISSQLDKSNNIINQIKSKVIYVPAVHDTIVKIDSASIFSLKSNNNMLLGEIEAIKKEKEKYQKKFTNSLIFAISLLIALIVSIIINFIKRR